jgi:hypothetical protein
MNTTSADHHRECTPITLDFLRTLGVAMPGDDERSHDPYEDNNGSPSDDPTTSIAELLDFTINTSDHCPCARRSCRAQELADAERAHADAKVRLHDMITDGRDVEHVLSQRHFTYEDPAVVAAIDDMKRCGLRVCNLTTSATEALRNHSNDTLVALYSAMAEDRAMMHFARLKCDYITALRFGTDAVTSVVRRQLAEHEVAYEKLLDELADDDYLAASRNACIAEMRCKKRLRFVERPQAAEPIDVWAAPIEGSTTNNDNGDAA